MASWQVYINYETCPVGITLPDQSMLCSQLEQIGNLNFNLGRLAGLDQLHSCLDLWWSVVFLISVNHISAFHISFWWSFLTFPKIDLPGPGLLDHLHTSIGRGGDPFSFGHGFSGFFGRQVTTTCFILVIFPSFTFRAELGGRGRMSAKPLRLSSLLKI